MNCRICSKDLDECKVCGHVVCENPLCKTCKKEASWQELAESKWQR